MKPTILRSDLKEVVAYSEYGGFLVEYKFGGTLNNNIKHDTYLKHYEDINELEAHAGATLLFLDDDEAELMFDMVSFGHVLAALMYEGNLPRMKYFDPDEYIIID